MKKLLLVGTALALTTGVASAASLNILGGEWSSVTTWNNNADASVNNTTLYQAGDAAPATTPGGVFPWTDDASVPAVIPDFTGTYGGTIETDGSGNVIGGSLIISGTIGDQVQVGGNSWWLRIWGDVTIDLATGASTAGSTDCYRTAIAPAPCFPAVLGGMPTAFNMSAGAPTPGACDLVAGTCGPDGPPAPLASFDAATGILSLFKEGRDAVVNTGGTDLLYQFQLETAVVPVPAAVWLFGSALGLLGFVRRRMTA
jgi:hypothetical protein